MREATTQHSQTTSARQAAPRAQQMGGSLATPERSRRVSRLESAAATPSPRTPAPTVRGEAAGIGSASLQVQSAPYANAHANAQAVPASEPDVWLVALPTATGGMRALEGAGRAGAIRVSRPYGHLRTIRPVALDTPFSAQAGSERPEASAATGRPRRSRALSSGLSSPSLGSASLGSATMLMAPLPTRSTAAVAASPTSARFAAASSADEMSQLPARRPLPSIVAAVEVETDAGVFRVERRDSVLAHSDIAWAMANLESGEPDSLVPLPRRQLALLLTLLPTAEDPEHPELDPTWGWAHKLRAPWERGPLHARGRLGRLIAFDPDSSGKSLHRACFELLGTEEIVWATGVPCFRTGSVYELVPLGKGLHPSRWLNWSLNKGRKRAGADEQPTWEIARIVFRVGAPRWPLAGIVEPLGPMGVAG